MEWSAQGTLVLYPLLVLASGLRLLDELFSTFSFPFSIPRRVPLSRCFSFPLPFSRWLLRRLLISHMRLIERMQAKFDLHCPSVPILLLLALSRLDCPRDIDLFQLGQVLC